MLHDKPKFQMPMDFFEDNQATIRVLETGKNLTLRHLNRTHKVDLACLFEAFKNDLCRLLYCTSEEQAADIFIKHFTDVTKFDQVCRCISHINKNELFLDSNKKVLSKPYVYTTINSEVILNTHSYTQSRL